MALLAQERQNEIMRLLRLRGVVRMEELAGQFQVSTETIRRDLERLEEQGYLRRVYGGAVLAGTAGVEPLYPVRASLHSEYKEAIGREGSRLVEQGDSLVVDLGTTTLEFARALGGHRNLTLITNCLQIAIATVELPGCQVILVGGHLRPKELAVSGISTIDQLGQFHVNKAILGAGGVDPIYGVTDYHVEEAQVRKVMAEIAAEVIVLADHSKFGVKALAQVLPPEEIDVLVTDWETSPLYLEQLAERGVKIIEAESDHPA